MLPRGAGWEPDPAATGSELNNPNQRALQDTGRFARKFARVLVGVRPRGVILVGSEKFSPQALGALFSLQVTQQLLFPVNNNPRAPLLQAINSYMIVRSLKSSFSDSMPKLTPAERLRRSLNQHCTGSKILRLFLRTLLSFRRRIKRWTLVYDQQTLIRQLLGQVPPD
jgi:hypothetical protein